MTLGHKYAVPEIHHDRWNIDLGDGTLDGPGPAHYPSESAAFVGAGRWIWIFAEANERRRSRGHGYEWDCFIFHDRGNSRWGFSTPEVHCPTETTGGLTSRGMVSAGRVSHTAEVAGYLHSHPVGVQGVAPEVLSEISTDENGEVTGDRLAAYRFGSKRWWLGLLTPRGTILRIRLSTVLLDAVLRANTSDPPNETVLKLLKRRAPGDWETIIDQQGRGGVWTPGPADWRAKALAAVMPELAKLPQGVKLKDLKPETCP